MVVYQSFYCIFFPLLEAVTSRLWVPQTTDSSTSVSRFFIFPRLFLYSGSADFIYPTAPLYMLFATIAPACTASKPTKRLAAA